MEAERDSAYWDEIVAGHWPQISSADWNALARAAENGAAGLDITAVGGRRRAFENTMRSGLMVNGGANSLQGHDLSGFGEALSATAVALTAIADLVDRTQHRILDVVDDATATATTLSRETHVDRSDNGMLGRVDEALRFARSEVEAIADESVRAAREIVTPLVDMITDRLAGAAGPNPTDSGSAGPRESILRTGLDRVPADERLQQRPLSDASDTYSEATAVAPTDRGASEGASNIRGLAASAPGVPAPMGPGQTPIGAPGDATGADLRDAITASGDRTVTRDSGEAREHTPLADRAVHDGVPATGGSPTPTGRAQQQSAVEAREPDVEPASGPVAWPMPASGTAMSSISRASATTTSAVGSEPGHKAAVVDARRVSARTSATTEAHGPATTPAGRPVLPATESVHKPTPAGRAETRTPPESADSGNRALREVVGSAMAAAAPPAFELGRRVDGDLALAQTLLGRVLLASQDTIGVDTAVAILRSQGGVSAFVTTNEGRGWLPRGLSVPHAMSSPWLWDIPEADAWEGLADPARVLAEFGIAWGRRIGAATTAIASTTEVSAELGRQLPDTAISGTECLAPEAVQPMGTGFVDRLGIAGSPELNEKADTTPVSAIASRRLQLVVSGHDKVRDAGLGWAESFDSAEVRRQILTTIRGNQTVDADCWHQLREADELVAASVLMIRREVNGVALGDLRPANRNDATLKALRGMGFERRCNELVLELENNPTRQSLRETFYSYAQIFTHPAAAGISATFPKGGNR
ncbi:hypothetical protein NN3_23260 [Nocardia neocaledoniensis NBRC 108232]|uniref:Excreted virulence factor EspC (Type VII ESX diderm) n=1 Tax=Nocardia neocaledoniensis TaxID=236511 RepID=A0A317N2P5_9NOCA|nr:hypothetical protein [Nocardia neocaledoniensis]PWV66944.1 hypothetical protein DFR69_1229 [Nocardia neocaledoniensis]GEM31319.1 hypothetical protein NN3_23260 [Nocardia neocaledoniensis NBRC 108232]